MVRVLYKYNFLKHIYSLNNFLVVGVIIAYAHLNFLIDNIHLQNIL